MKDIIVFENDIPADFDLKGDIAIDTETMGLNLNRDRLCVIQICDSRIVCLVRFNSYDYSAPNLKALLQRNKSVKIFHYARFDLAAIKKYLDITLDNIFCTKIASKLVRTYTDYHGLKDLCRELLGVALSKQQQSSDWGSGCLSTEQKKYAANDVIYLHALRDKLQDMLKREGRLGLAEGAFAFLNTRVDLDLSGWDEVDIFAHS